MDEEYLSNINVNDIRTMLTDRVCVFMVDIVLDPDLVFVSIDLFKDFTQK